MTSVKRIVRTPALGVAMVIGFGVSAPPAQAAYIATLAQQGSDVVATGSGTLNLASLTLLSGFSRTFGLIEPDIGQLQIGPSPLLVARTDIA